MTVDHGKASRPHIPHRLTVIGGGGHAKVVIATAEAAGWTIAGVLDDDPARHVPLLGHAVTGPTAKLLGDPEATCVLAIGANAVRRRLAQQARCRFATLVHPSAVVHPSVRLGPGTVVFAGAVIQPDATLGAHVIVNTSASIDHDCVLGDAVHVAPGTRLAGGVTLGDEVFLGIGAAVIPNVSIGARTTVGAGGVVVADLPAEIVAVGVPARRKP